MRLRSLLVNCLDKFAESPVVVFLDALDECNEPERLLTCLKECLKDRAKLFCTSRTISSLELHFQSLHCLDDEDASAQIREYVTSHIAGIKYLEPAEQDGNPHSFRQRLIDKVCEAADGLWLYARLMLYEIDRAPGKASLLHQLERSPVEMTGMYDQIMSNIETYLTDQQLALAQQILLWANVPDWIDPGNLLAPNRLPSGTLDIVLRHKHHGEPVFDPAKLVQDVCSPFIKVCKAPEAQQDYQNFELDFVHLSAQQHIHEATKRSQQHLPKLLRPQRLRILQRAATAAWYFTECPYSTIYLRAYSHAIHDNIPIDRVASLFGAHFDMSYGLWNAFTAADIIPHELEADETAIASHILDILADFVSTRKCLKWIESTFLLNFPGFWITVVFELVKSASRVADVAKIHDNTLPALGRFRRASQAFFRQYRWVLLHHCLPLEYSQSRQFPKDMRSCTEDEAELYQEIIDTSGHIHRIVNSQYRTTVGKSRRETDYLLCIFELYTNDSISKWYPIMLNKGPFSGNEHTDVSLERHGVDCDENSDDSDYDDEASLQYVNRALPTVQVLPVVREEEFVMHASSARPPVSHYRLLREMLSEPLQCHYFTGDDEGDDSRLPQNGGENRIPDPNVPAYALLSDDLSLNVSMEVIAVHWAFHLRGSLDRFRQELSAVIPPVEV